ncbi:sensor histidine kinase [Mesorhizobium sp. BAC0120]|uniref:sensor histidine kinase n=1 Tax=Mesorhizobium sp. BAC0120 TaxID=3090670 RepID=UPI00298D304E|nr:sensor histidine kinase [Mesorhizobium sp. BAC0120]MDW6020942.1 sensor histidine kinase [Mesorhizobium sp. BAC0120]
MSLIAMALVGIVVTRVIEDSVTRNSAASTALYVDSVIAPLLPDMRKNEALSDPVAHALDETLGQGALGKRLVSFRLWGKDGTILYANDRSLVGKRFEPSPNLETAFAGKMVAEFNQVDDIESKRERESGQMLLEIYNPVLQPWSGEVVAVSEFYEIATDFERSLLWARVWSWLAVAAATLGFFLVLSAIVFRGSRTITQQSHALRARVLELSGLLAQNRLLHARVQRASQRAVALNESYLRRIGADLHDGPAQLVALASMKLDGSALLAPCASPESRDREIDTIKSSLDEALYEIRSICRGLILPHIETQRTRDVIAHAAQAHEQRTGATVRQSLSDEPCELSPSGKICAYRFVQEALSNAYRHAGGAGQAVRHACEAGRVIIEVSDSGPGFDPTLAGPEALGLAGLRERVESLGGVFTLETSERGTIVRMVLDVEEVHAP